MVEWQNCYNLLQLEITNLLLETRLGNPLRNFGNSSFSVCFLFHPVLYVAAKLVANQLHPDLLNKFTDLFTGILYSANPQLANFYL